MKKNVVLLLILISICVSFSFGSAAKKTQRNFMMILQLNDYSLELKEAVNYFFKKVFQKGDQLIIVTPVKLYGYSKQRLAQPQGQLVNEILTILKKDITTGSVRYQSVITEMRNIVKELEEAGEDGFQENEGIEGILQSYKNSRENLKLVRRINENMLLKLSQIFRGAKGENHILMFYQEELRPIPNRDTMDLLRSDPGLSFKAQEIFLIDKFKPTIDIEKVKAAFDYASVSLHFLYFKSKKIDRGGRVKMMENSGDMYNQLAKLAKATKGTTLTSSKPSAFIKKVEQVFTGEVKVEVVEEEKEE